MQRKQTLGAAASAILEILINQTTVAGETLGDSKTSPLDLGLLILLQDLTIQMLLELNHKALLTPSPINQGL